MNRHTKRATDECEQVIESMNRLRRSLPELDRRNRYVVGGDGYPSTSFGTGGQRGAVSQPTERAALAPVPADPVRQATKETLKALVEVARLAARIDNLLAVVVGEDVSVERCSGCNRADVPRLVAGRCDACRMRSRRAVSA